MKNAFMLPAMLAMLAMLALLWAAPGALAQQADAKAGQAAYTKSCVSCHAADGSPKEAIAKMMKVEMRHLGAKEVQAKTDSELRKDTLEGVGKMKAVKNLTDRQVVDLIAFVRTLAAK
ncbi:MAG TPA: cytochrome c [Anaerolineales bacterium]